MMKWLNPSDSDLRYHKKEFIPKYISKGVVDLTYLLHEFQELASDQIESLGMGSSFEKENQFMYVVMRYKGYFLKDFQTDEKYLLVTYPMQASAVQMYRYAYILDSKNEVVFYLISLWVMVDSVNRRIKSTKAFKNKLSSLFPDIDKLEPISKEILTNFALDEFDFVPFKEYQVQEKDIDGNGHMNNTIYCQIVQNALNKEKIKEFTINFERECFLGETLKLFLAEKEEEKIIQGQKEDSSLSFKMRIRFS